MLSQVSVSVRHIIHRKDLIVISINQSIMHVSEAAKTLTSLHKFADLN